MIVKLLDVGAATKLLKPSHSTELDGFGSALALLVEKSPHLEAISLFASGERNASSVHVLGKPIDKEGLKESGYVPTIDAIDVVVDQPAALDGLLASLDILKYGPPSLS